MFVVVIHLFVVCVYFVCFDCIDSLLLLSSHHKCHGPFYLGYQDDYGVWSFVSAFQQLIAVATSLFDWTQLFSFYLAQIR